VFAEDEAALLLGSGRDGADLEALVGRRIGGEPLETVLGWVAFGGRRLTVRPGVFVARRRTELLARMAAARCGPGSVLLELCCGIAPVAATVTAGEIHVVDLDPLALECARINVPRGHAHVSDLYADLPVELLGRIDVVAANAPYVPTDRIELMPPEARDHEQRLALDGGPDGVDLHRRIAADAPEWLAAGGALMIETSRSQAPLTEQAMLDAGLETQVVIDDELDGCVVLGRSPMLRAGEPV
jgi:release factor glutamine methyltransferase